MTAQQARSRSRFDPTASFIVARSFVMGGLPMTPGDAIDKAALPLRRLRQLYEMGQIKVASGAVTKRAVARRCLIVGGKNYDPGDEIPAGSIASERRLLQMVQHGDVRLDAAPSGAPRMRSRRVLAGSG